jgi:hypothetical protein
MGSPETVREPLRIRIPRQTYDEEVGDEYATFGELCMYIRPYEACGLCNIENERMCSMCFALHSRKIIDDPALLHKCLDHFDRWFRTLLKRKKEKRILK